MAKDFKIRGEIVRGNIAKIRKIISEHPEVLDSFAVNKSLLHWAAQEGNTEIMEVFVNAGIPIDILTSDGINTPLNTAATQGRLEACRWLLDHGADIEWRYEDAGTPIFSAIYSRSTEVVELFIERGANLGVASRTNSIIDFANSYGTADIVALLQRHLQE